MFPNYSQIVFRTFSLFQFCSNATKSSNNEKFASIIAVKNKPYICEPLLFLQNKSHDPVLGNLLRCFREKSCFVVVVEGSEGVPKLFPLNRLNIKINIVQKVQE